MFQEAGFLQGDVWLWCVSLWRLCVTSVCLSANVFMLVSIYISLAVGNRYLLMIVQATRDFNVSTEISPNWEKKSSWTFCDLDWRRDGGQRQPGALSLLPYSGSSRELLPAFHRPIKLIHGPKTVTSV